MQQPIVTNYSVDIVNILEEDCQGYDGVILFYILKGNINAVNGEHRKTLNVQDLLIINQNEVCQLSSTMDNIIIKVAISHRYFSRYYTNYAVARFALEMQENNLYLKMLREIITRLALSKLQENKETGLLEVNALLSNLLSLLIMNFKQQRSKVSVQQETGLPPRIEKTLIYLKDNYNKPLSLSLIAKINHTSSAYFSRLFSREVGTSFKTYLTQLRFMYCVEALSKTSKPLYQIVEENGFNDTRNFTALFKAKYGMTPHQFRASGPADKSPTHIQHQLPPQISPARPTRLGEIHPAELLALLANSLNINEQITDIEPITTEKMTISLAQTGTVAPTLSHPGYIVNVDRLEEVLKAHVQQQIITARQKMPLQYVQVEHIVSESTLPQVFTTDENCPSFSPYTNADTAIEFLHHQGVGLLISIYFQPTEQDMRYTTSRFLDFIAHSITLFGVEYVSTWAFIYYPNTDFLAESTSRFMHLRGKIKELLPGMSAGLFYPFPIDEEAITRLPFFASELAKKLDFIGFSANANDLVNRKGFKKEDFAHAELFIQQRSLHIIGQLKKYGLATPLFLQTWNTLTGDTRHTNGSFFRGALLMNTLLSLPQQVASVGFWINSEVQNEAQENKRIDTSSLSLFYIGNTRRPMFHVLCLRERLSGKVLAKGENYLVTVRPQGYRVLLTNSVTFNPFLSLQNHLVNGFRKQLNVAIFGLEQGTYQIKRHLFDQLHGALYHQFECQPTRFGRDSEVMQFIDLHSAPDLHLYDESIGSCWKASVEMDVNAICLFEINRIAIP